MTQTFREFVSRVNPRYAWHRHCVELADVLQQVADGTITRLMVFLPPRHSKSETVSRLFSAYYLARFPDRWVGLTSYAADLAFTLSRHARDNYQAGGGATRQDASAVKHWETGKGGGFWAAGVGGPITGKGGHLLIVDDPLKNAEEANSETIREKQKEWYRSTFSTRAEPGAAIIVVQCLTGDTLVLLADGTERPLASIRAGDQVATYDNGRLSSSTVLNWKAQGPDLVFAISLQSGTTIRGNERHPFLVERDGGTEWIRLSDLRIGDRVLRAIGGSGAAPSVLLKAATSPQSARAIATRTTKRTCGHVGIAHRRSTPNLNAQGTSNTATALPLPTITPSLPHRMASAPCAGICPPPRTCGPTGAANSASITIPKPERFEGFSATTATSPSGTERPKRPYFGPLDIFEIIPDRIIEIAPAGREDVFDIQVEGTENFIANGLISHNTRWHMDDLAGWLLSEEGGEDEHPEGWHIVHLPAIAEDTRPSYPASCTVQPDWRTPGEALCPERYPLPRLQALARRVGEYFWAALFQGRPAPRVGGMFKREWWQYFNPDLFVFPHVLELIQVWDTAFKAKQENDYSVCSTWALLPDGVYVLDVWRAKVEFPELKREARAQYAKWHPAAVLIEDKASGQSLIQELRRDTGIPIIAVAVDADKSARAAGVTPYVEARRVFLPEGAPWVSDWIDEHARFPRTTHDDQVDTTSIALKRLVLGGAPTLDAALGDTLANYVGW